MTVTEQLQLDWNLPFSIALLLCATALGIVVFGEFRHGRVWWIDGAATRAEQPIWFWTIAFQYAVVLLIALLLCIAFIVRASGLVGPYWPAS